MAKIPPMQQLVSFRCLDNFLDSCKESSQAFCELFAQKQKMIQYVKEKKIVAKTYKAILAKKYKQTSNDEVKFLIQMDLLSLNDINSGDVEAWFQDCINQTGLSYTQQHDLYQKYVNPSISIKENSINKIQTKVQKEQVEYPFSPQEVINFKGLDSFMEQYQSNKPIFDKLFQKKQKLLGLVSDKKLNPDMYKKLLQTKLEQIKNSGVRSLVQMDLDFLQELHNGNIEQWFKQILSETKQNYQDQCNIFKGIKVPTKKISDLDGIVDVPQIDMKTILGQQNKQKGRESVKKSEIKNAALSGIKNNGQKILPRGQFVSFKQLDQLLDSNKGDPEKFIQLFDKKKNMFQEIKMHKLTAQVYHSLLKKSFEKCEDEEIKFQLKLQLEDLDDLYSGDMKQWFQEVVNDTGQYYEQQEKIYNIHKNPLNKNINRKSVIHQELLKPSFSIRASTRIRIDDRVEPSNQRYSVNQIVSFSALSELLGKYYEQDKEYFIKLEDKKTKFLKLVSDQKLQGQTYRLILGKQLNKIKTPYLVYMMKEQLRSLKEQFADNEYAWFVYLVKHLKNSNRSQGKNSVTVSKLKGKIQLTDVELLQADPKTKVDYLLRKISRYQSVLVFFKNNDLQQEAYNFVKMYYLSLKNEVIGYKQQLEKGNIEDLQKLDVVQFRKKKIGQINFERFHAGLDKAAYENKLNQAIKTIKETQTEYKKYQAGIKKACNTNNKEQTKKRIQLAEKDIAYINSLKNKEFAVPPKVEIFKTQKFNMDLNKLDQDEIEVSVHNISGLTDKSILKIYIDQKKERQSKQVNNGDPKIAFKCKIDKKKMQQIINGSDNKVLVFRIFQKGWFGSQKLAAEQGSSLEFVRHNIFEGKVMLKQGKVQINFTAKVWKAKKPIVTIVNDYKITKYPQYRFDQRIQEQFIKKQMPYVEPSQSEIHT